MSQNNQQNQRRSAINAPNDDLQEKIANSITFHDNLGERILTISESKLKLCLTNNIKHMENRGAWQAPAGVALTIVITILTSNFRDWILPMYTWQAIFIVCGLLSVIWLFYTLLNIPKAKNVDDVVNELMPPQNENVKKGKK